MAGGRPDKAAYDVQQERLKSEIFAWQTKLNAVRDKISVATKSGPGNEQRNALRAELDSIRSQQFTNKSSRGKILEQVKATQEAMQKKIKDLQTAKGKIPFKTVADVDAHIKNLDKQVESGTMRLVDEKRALQEISQSKRNRRIVEAFQADQDAIDADRKQIEELKTQLDDPAQKAISDRFDAIKAEMDALKKVEDEAYANRSKVFEERDGIQAQINALWSEKRESSRLYREANDRYWAKVNEDRARRAERLQAQRAAEEAEKKREIAERIREQSEISAYQAEIEDCQTLIDYFSGNRTGHLNLKTVPDSAKTELSGVPKLDIRQVDTDVSGVVARKKGEEGHYFVASKKGGKKKGHHAKSVTPEPASASTTSGNLNVSYATLSALLSLSIPPPVSQTDVARLIEDLQTKKAWFEANQARKTAENVAKADAEIRRLTGGNNSENGSVPQSEGETAPETATDSTPAKPEESS
ncbi:hypothetical protein FISHEDRAFT_65259 [Fistulina hepatica ATCC 64428]|nr:hypothetical protein FISHEDRAFT_65259 [Fistulina hepatica ATCC 64428]